MFEYMDYKPTIRLKGGLTLSPDDMQGNVELKGVTFAYPSRPDQVHVCAYTCTYVRTYEHVFS